MNVGLAEDFFPAVSGSFLERFVRNSYRTTILNRACYDEENNQ